MTESAVVHRYRADVVLEVTAHGVATHRNGAMDVADGRVVAIGTDAVLGPVAPGTPVSHLGGLVMPGLVNVHCHAPMVIFRSAGDGLPLDRWLREAIWPREGAMTRDDVRAGMLLGSAEMLTSGVTTSMEMYLHDDAIFEAVAVTGARLVSTPGIISALHGNDLAGRIDEIIELHRQFHRPDGRTTVGFGPHSTYDLGADMMRVVGDAARSLDAVFHIHLEETREERQLVLERDGVTATRLLAESGALDNRVIAAHGVWLDDHDRTLLAQAGASVAHCPSSNLKLGSGFADVRALLDVGVNVAVATDGAASADSLDLWHGIRIAPGIARALRNDAAALSVETALLMATANAGRAIGRPDVGTLTAGSRADFIRIDLDRPVFRPALDDHELLAHLVFNGTGRDVTDVWIDGEPVVVDGRCVGVDIDVLAADVDRRARALLSA